jgi:deoxyribodipyrimidine photo-lyase
MHNTEHTGIGLMWFRNDLRLQDNEALAKAIAENASVLPIYIFDTRSFRTSTYGFKKIGPFRAQFLLESVY